MEDSFSPSTERPGPNDERPGPGQGAMISMSTAHHRNAADRGMRLSARITRVIPWVLGGIAVAWLGYQFWRLTLRTGGMGAVDLKLRWHEVQGWFAGVPVYHELSNAMYPPASYLLLWPFLGTVNVVAARWLWALLQVAVLAGLSRMTLRHGRPRSRGDRVLLILLPLALYATGACIGNGQLGLVVVLFLMASLTRLEVKGHTFFQDLVIASLFLIALVKPTLSVFFFWLLFFRPGGFRPAGLTVGLYALSTLIASLFQRAAPWVLLKTWFGRGVAGAEYGATRGEGSMALVREAGESIAETLRITHINAHSLLGYFNLSEFNTVATFILLALLGVWIWFARKRSIWPLLGVTAIVARFSTYHGWYDDVLLLLPLIALFRLLKEREESSRPLLMARSLFIAMVLSLLAPGGIYTLPHPLNNAYAISQALVWGIVLCVLAHRSGKVIP